MKYIGVTGVFIWIGISLCCFIATAQIASADRSQPAAGAGKSEQATRLTHLAEAYRINENYPSAIATAQQGAGIALQQNDLTAATKAYTVLANVYANTKQFAILKKTSDTTLSIAQKARTPIAMAYGYYIQAVLYNALDNADSATNYAQLALKVQGQKPEPYISAKIYYLLYALNTLWDDVPKVNAYAQKAAENALLAGDYNLLSNCYIAQSTAADYNYQQSKSTEQRDLIISYLRKVEDLHQQHPKEVAQKTYAIACINSADFYLRNFPATDDQAKANAIQYANLAKTAAKSTAFGQEIMASSLGILSEYAKRDKKPALEENYLLEAYTVMLDQKDPYYYTLVNVVTALANLYEKNGNYTKALEFQKKVTEYKAKLFDRQQALNSQKLEIQYETEKKNNEVLMLKQREQYSRMQNYFYIGIAAVSLLGLIFMFRSYHFRLRYSLQREKQLQLEKQEAELQMKLEKEEQSRLKAEQQLLEAQQQQLQKEAMANLLQLEHKKDMLLQIKEKINDNDLLNINKIWNEEQLLDNDFEDVKLQIQQVHPDFFYLLNERTQQKLTPLDLKLCAYLHLKMDTKKIAQILHIEPKSVRMSRYRIKQKLGLGKEEDLNVFLQNLG